MRTQPNHTQRYLPRVNSATGAQHPLIAPFLTSKNNLPLRFRIRRSCGLILSFFGLLSAFFFFVWLWPQEAKAFSWILILIGFLLLVLSIIRRNRTLYRNSKITLNQFFLKSVIEIAEVGCAAVAAILLAGSAARVVGSRVGNSAESAMPGVGAPAGLFGGLMTAAVVGLATGYIIRLAWQWIAGKILPMPH